MSEQNFRDCIANNLLMMYLLGKADELGTMQDNVKLQKSVFLSQKKFIDNGMKGFSYNFFRWKQGPFSKDVNIDLSSLKHNKLVDWSDEKISLTHDGEELLNQCDDLLKENQSFCQIIDLIIQENINLTPEGIKEKVYNMKVIVPQIRKLMSIRDIPFGRLILFKQSRRRIKSEFEIDESWLATLELIFDEETLKILGKAYGDAINGRVASSL